VYPAPSDFTRSEGQAAWWYRELTPGQRQVCNSDGYNFLLNLAEQIRDRLGAGGKPTWDGALVTSADPSLNTTSPAWSGAFLRALYAAARADRAPAAYLSAIQADAANSRVSPGTLQVALWLAYYNAGWAGGGFDAPVVYGQGSPNEVRIPQGAVLPRFGTPMPPTPVAPGDTCITPSVAGPPAHASLGGGSPFSFNLLLVVGGLVVLGVAGNFLMQNVLTDEEAQRRRRS
jgi:hypothetical protein